MWNGFLQWKNFAHDFDVARIGMNESFYRYNHNSNDDDYDNENYVDDVDNNNNIISQIYFIILDNSTLNSCQLYDHIYDAKNA